jgi:uncharacterized membrane protein
VVFAALGMGMIFISNGARAANPASSPPAFYTADERAAFDWMLAQETPGAPVLTTADKFGEGSGNRLVGAIAQRVFIGHPYETADWERKLGEVAQFYNPATEDGWRRDFLRENGLRYVWYDAYARELGEWNPANADFLTPVFETETVTVYQVEDAASEG